MKLENIHFSSKTIELSESDTVLKLRSRLCYYGDKNLNDTMLPIEGAEDFAQSLINMPVQARVVYNDETDQETFGGHEAMVNPINGELQLCTESIGTHTGVEIKEELVETVSGEFKTLPCLYADYVIWKRYPMVVEIVKRLHSENRLHSSWELQSDEYTFSEGVKTLTSYKFIGNCLLGENKTPAYGHIANSVSLSQLEFNSPELLIAEALSKDIANNNEEVNNLKNDKTKAVVSEDEVKATDSTIDETAMDETTTEDENIPSDNGSSKQSTALDLSALTVDDLYRKLTKAVEAKLETWCFISQMFPSENTIWVRAGTAESELDYVLFTYSVSGDDIQLSEPSNVKLTVSLSDVNQKVDELRNNMLKASETIQSLNSEISTLSVYKEKFEQAEQERIEAEHEEKVNSLKQYAVKSGFISEDEVNADDGDISTLISDLNESGIKAIIAERFMESMENAKSANTLETSEKKNTQSETLKVHLATKDGFATDVAEFKKAYFNK